MLFGSCLVLHWIKGCMSCLSCLSMPPPRYYDVYIMVEPKRQELASANEKLAGANATLKEVQDKVVVLNAKVAALEESYNKVRA